MKHGHDIWVFGDYRNYFQNRVTLQILAKAVDLASTTKGSVCAVVFGHNLDEYVSEYIAHGARKVYVVDHPSLATYSMETYAWLMSRLAQQYQPETLLVG
ncbi:MAG: electron transfer flavoprotein subunit alpha/FixB family protein, partial [Deltaproteobacteria bacterium]